ncbi:SHOCT domain-containing protein [Rhizorhabdus wittichii]|jgi:hypothetical protein|uniref:SHOCT domain-containing protein n=1 Tax=Rhizorhabdus wittichii TaxID=160791 RepID=A0A975D2G3_9SPHN|nr:SHOCT domain-containing protein [Rhizorhabdus wittichii]QTH21722.1 SHOCT domain-containing protein [Rhizorhabdus wittichii]
MIDAASPLKTSGITIWTEGDVLVLKYGVLYYGFLGTKRVPAANITALNWREPGDWLAGFLEISILGEQPPSPMASPNVQNQNRLKYERADQPKFVALKEWIEARMAKPQGGQPAASSIADELGKLAALLRDGVITQDEFDQQKAKLLA